MRLVLGHGTYEDPEELLKSGDGYTKSLLLKDLYNRYVNLRYLAGGNGCAKSPYLKVYSTLHKPENLKRIEERYGYTEEELDYFLNLAKENLPFIK